MFDKAKAFLALYVNIPNALKFVGFFGGAVTFSFASNGVKIAGWLFLAALLAGKLYPQIVKGRRL